MPLLRVGIGISVLHAVFSVTLVLLAALLFGLSVAGLLGL